MIESDLEPWHWFLLTLLCVMIEGFYSMQEMAIVSINRLELIYDCARGSRRARWISKLLQRPDRLFTTTLLMVNLVLQLGSECSRRFYQSLELASSMAPLTQVILVVICAELAPMFAARQHSRQVAFFGAPILYATSTLLRPVTAVVAWISDILNRLLGASKESFTMVSREDLKSIVRRLQPHQEAGPESFLEKVGSNILEMPEICAKDIATPLHACATISSKATLEQLRQLFDKERSNFALAIDPVSGRLAGVVLPRFLFDPAMRQHIYVYQLAKSALLVRASDTLTRLLPALRQSRYSMAVVVDAQGVPVGSLSFDEIAYYLFGAHHSHAVHASGQLIERTFDLKTRLGILRHRWALEFGLPDEWTLEQFLLHIFERSPELGERCLHRGIEMELVEGSSGRTCLRIKAFVHREPS